MSMLAPYTVCSSIEAEFSVDSLILDSILYITDGILNLWMQWSNLTMVLIVYPIQNEPMFY